MKYGNHTFAAWLVANYETLTNIIAIAAYAVVAARADIPAGESKATIITMTAILFLLTKGIMGGAPSKSAKADIVPLLFTLIAYAACLLPGSHGIPEIPGLKPLLIASALISLVLATIAATFTCRHFEEVVSRRMFYLNSHVSLFSSTLSYTLNRFIAFFCNTSATILLPFATAQFFKFIANNI